MTIKDFEDLYYTLHSELELIIETTTDTKKQIEYCYGVAIEKWQYLKKKISGFEFQSAADEIYFFKKVKPLFTSEIEYFRLLYQFETFKPHYENRLDLLVELEKRRWDKFILEHNDFYTYYLHQQTCSDEQYFLRKNNSETELDHTQAHDMEMDARTSHDYLVANILALEKYDMYLNDALRTGQ